MIKSIFARPVFINPQAYLVIPQLANLSMLEPIDFTSTNTYSFESLGKVESKIISTKDEYILHIDLYESYGSCVLGEFYIGPATIGSIDDFTITTNGYITTIEVGGGDSGDIVYPGLIAAWSAKGKTNDDEDRAILKDLTGNGHDITLNGFAFSEMSGYGGYSTNFMSWTYDSVYLSCERTPTKVVYTCVENMRWHNLRFGFSVALKLKFIADFDGIVRYKNIAGDNYVNYNFNSNEIVEVELIGDFDKYIHFRPNNPIVGEKYTIELLPEYPDALVFDGVDDYGQSIDKIKVLTEYTVVLKRNIIKPIEYAALFYKGEGGGDVNSNFFIEYYDAMKWYYGNGSSSTEIKYYDENIIYVTGKSYNGKTVDMDFGSVVDNPVYLGKITGNWCHNMAFYSAYLFDRSLDEQEIKEFIRKYIDPEYLLPSEIPTPDCYYDFSLGSNDNENRETIKDQSGNGNDAKAYNIALAGMSGYGGYNLPIEGLTIDGTYNGVTRVYGYDIPNGVTLNKLRFNISGLENNTISIRIQGLNYSYNISENGYHELKAITNDSGSVKTFEIMATVFTYNNVVIEFLPEYPGALVLDGVDDYIALEQFDSGFKTIFVLCNIFDNNNNKFIYDQRSGVTGTNQYALYIHDGSPAYNYRNNGSTYINSKLNTTLVPGQLFNKKHCITVTNDTLETITPIIGASALKFASCSMAIYKFLGFKDELTEEQIQAIIKKYNLLDGVDEIEVS